MKIALGCDHGGYELKEYIARVARTLIDFFRLCGI